MGKYKNTVFFAAVLAAFGTGCTDDGPEGGPVDKGPFVIRVGARGDEGTKTSIDRHNKIRWEIGDRIGLFTDYQNIDNVELTLDPESLTDDGYWGWFEGNIPVLPPDAADYCSYYPYQPDAERSGNELTMSFPGVQQYVPGGIDGSVFPMVAMLEKETATEIDFMFKNVFSVVKLELWTSVDELELQQVLFSGNSGEVVAGKFSADAATYHVRFLPGGGLNAALHTGAGGLSISTNESDPTVVMMIVPPLEFEEGFSFRFVTRKGNFNKTVGSGAGITLERNKLYEPGVLEVVPEEPHDFNDPGYWGLEGDAPVYANTYTVGSYEKFCFDASVIGNGNKGLQGVADEAGLPDVAALGFHTDTPHIVPAEAKVLWQSAENLISEVVLHENKVCLTTGAGTGNAVIAVYDHPASPGEPEPEILWSWHIWVTDADFYHGSGSLKEYPGRYVAMDRNLGATSSLQDDPLSNGLYYEWGRKDPFMDRAKRVYGEVSRFTTIVSGTLEDAVKNPASASADQKDNGNDWLRNGHNDYLWGNPDQANAGVKSIYDPCPVGYRVPPAGFWDSFTQTGRNGMNGYVHTHNGVESWYPAANRLEVWWHEIELPVWSQRYGFYFSSTALPGAKAAGFEMDPWRLTPGKSFNRALCQSIRCVRE